jgi:riboflavin-specific deaminase-like protein
MPPPDIPSDDIDEAAWRRVLARAPGDEGYPRLYAPFLGPAAMPDGCFVLGRIAQTLDGRIATESGMSFWISGPEDILHTHRLRAVCDAIVVGAGTVKADDPLLTTRLCEGPSPVRVVIDTDRRLGGGYRLFQSEPATLVLVADDIVGPGRLGRAEVVALPRGPGGGLSVPAVVAALAARGLKRIIVEGGGITVSRLLAAGALDRLHVTVAPLLLGSGIPSFTLAGVPKPEDGLRLTWEVYRLGADLLFDIPLQRADARGPLVRR